LKPNLRHGLGTTDYSICELFFEDKTVSKAFDDTEEDASIRVPPQTERKRALGQSVDYITSAFEACERTHCFSISGTGMLSLYTWSRRAYATLSGLKMRFMRWDRSVVVVSCVFSYVDNPYLLAAFLEIFCMAPRYVRGWDTTVERVDEKEASSIGTAAAGAIEKLRAYAPYVANFEQPARRNIIPKPL
jgi:hypothetical protein